MLFPEFIVLLCGEEQGEMSLLMLPQHQATTYYGRLEEERNLGPIVSAWNPFLAANLYDLGKFIFSEPHFLYL